MAGKELVLVAEDLKAAEVFDGSGAIEPVLARIAEQARAVVYDVSTKAGRDGIASLAYQVARSKTYLDGLGKGLVADIKRQVAVVDRDRKRVRDFLDELRAEVRGPLDEFEARERARVVALEGRVAAFSGLASPGVLLGVGLRSLRENLRAVKAMVVDESFEEFQEAALHAKEKAVRLLGLRIAEIEKDMAEREAARTAELARIEEEERVRVEERAAVLAAEREEQLRERVEAETRARVEAEHRAALQREVVAESEEEEQGGATIAPTSGEALLMAGLVHNEMTQQAREVLAELLVAHGKLSQRRARLVADVLVEEIVGYGVPGVLLVDRVSWNYRALGAKS